MKKTPRIVNIIEMADGEITGIDTFVIPEGIIPHSKKENEIVAIAEKLFATIAKENGMDEDEKEACIEDGFYESGSYKVLIHWSNENTHEKIK